MENQDQIFMQRCLQLANNGKGKTSPNPMVGAVIVHNGKIIGEGWHQKAGMPHAEPNAIASVKNKALLKESTIYVSLEPCSHFGKTPPCSDLIIEHRIPRVVIASVDSNHLVCGNGISKLRSAGAEVVIGVLDKENRELNHVFFCVQEKKRPFVLLKWAQSNDGFIDYRRNELNKGASIAISSYNSRQNVHQLRSSYDAILVGKNTVLNDNPNLNSRLYKGKDPIRVILDRRLEIPKNFNIYDNSQKTYIVNEIKSESINSITELLYLNFNSKNFVGDLLQLLLSKNVSSVLVEGGKATIESFVKSNLWDRAMVYISPNKLFDGLKVPVIDKQKLILCNKLGEDQLESYLNQ